MITSMYLTGAQIVAHTSGTWRCHYLYLFCVLTGMVASTTTRVCRVWKIVACSGRDMAYATILVRFVYLMWCSDSCPHEWDMAVPLSLYMFCVLTGVCVVGR